MSGTVRRRPRALVLVLSLALSGAACSESPAAGFEDFYGALVSGDERVLSRLSESSRRQVEDAARAQGLDPTRALARGGVRSTLRAIRERERDATSATLEVEDALGNTELVTMVLQGGRWRVQLSAQPAGEDAAP